MVLNIHRNLLGRGGIIVYHYTVTTRMTHALRSPVCHFNVSLIVRDKVTRQCPQTTTFEEKGEPKRIRTEVPLLTSLTPYRQAKPAHTRLHKPWTNLCRSMAQALTPRKVRQTVLHPAASGPWPVDHRPYPIPYT